MGGGNNDIAVCGLGIKVADADNVDQYWENLLNKKNSIREVPPTRWNMKKFLHPDGKKGFYYSAFGSFIDDIDQFDPTPFRGISALEVPAMDPQHRWILQCAYQAFEDAGIDAYSANVDGSRTGVFIGLMNHDYMGQLTDLDDIEQANNTFVTGICGSIAPNRVSYVFNLLGPSFCVDTACSSSIVALHQACQAIINNECDSALVGGVNFMNSPTNFVILSQAKMMSKTGGCKAFDERGDGYTRGEGCGVVLIKRLSDAIRDKNKIYAVIKGTGVNSDGRTQAPMTSPSETMQFQLMEEVFKKANIDPSTISYIEAHGTGTPVGDPVEARAIGKFLGAGSGRDNKLWMGSVKTNIGHLEGASGLAALIKVCLMMKHKTIAPNLYFETPNPTIPFEELKLNVPTQSHPWPAPEGTKQGRRAALNCFGFGGTNSHCILEEYIPPTESSNELHPEISQHHAIALSAVDSSALKAYASSLLLSFQNSPDLLLQDVGYTSFRRTHLKERAVIFPSSRDHAINLLSAFSDDSKAADLEKQGSIIRGASQGDKRICFVFSGQGTFWAGVGKVLIDTQPIFNSAIKEVDEYLEPLAKWTVWKTLNDMPKDDDNYSAPQYVATVCIFAIQIALVRLLAQWNIKPSFIVGHSVGETAAAVVSGAISLKDGVTLVHHRARLQSTLEGSGKMAAVAISEQEAETWLKPYGGKLEIAAVNSPLSLTIAGDGACILDFETKFKEANPDKMFVTLRLNSPYHTSFMEPMKKEFLECCGDIQSQDPTVPIYSTVTGRKFESGNYSGNYFWENIRDPVLFSKAIQAVNKEEGCTIFLEIGPHPALGFNINQINTHSSKKTWTVVGTLSKKDKKWSSILKSLSRLHITSVPVDWTEFYSSNYFPKLVTLPSYQWQTKRYWIEGSHSIYMKHSSKQAGATNGASQSKHPLLQSPVVRDQKKGWQVELSTSDFPYLKDHNILGTLVLAAAFPLELTIAAAHNMRDSTAAALGDNANKYAVGVNFLVENPVLITPPTAPILKLDVDGTNLSLGDSVPFKILQSAKEGSKDAGSGRGSLFCVTKEVARSVRDTANKIIDNALADESRDRKNKQFRRYTQSEVYNIVAKHDYNFGPAHQGTHTAWIQQNASTAVGLIEIPESIEDTTSDYYLHPSLIDAIFHPSILCRTTELTVVPTCIQMIFFNKPKSRKMWSVFNIQNPRYPEFIMLDEDRKTVIFHMPYFMAKSMNATSGVEKYEQMWTPTTPTPLMPNFFSNNQKRILVLASQNEIGKQVVKSLSKYKKTTIVTAYMNTKTSQSKDKWQVDPFDEAGMASLVDQTVLSGTDIWDAIIYMWPTEEILSESNPKYLTMGHKSCAGLLHLLKPVLNGSKIPYPRVIAITSGATAVVGEKQVNVGQSTLYGFARSAILEYPDLRLSMLDIDPQEDSASISASVQNILAELSSSEGYCDETAYRGDRCFKNVMQEASALPVFQQDNTNSGVARIESVAVRQSSTSGKLTFSANPQRLECTSTQVPIKAKKCGVLPHFLNSSLPPIHSGGFPTPCILGKVEIANKSQNLSVGEEIIAIGSLPATSQANVEYDTIVRRLKKWDDSQAVTVPSVLAIAYYAINYEALVRSRDSVLIVGNTVGLGVAAALLAKKLTVKVHALVPEASVNLLGKLGVKALSLNTTQFWKKNDEITKFDVVISFLDNADDEEYASLNNHLANLLNAKARFVGLSKNKTLSESSAFRVSQQTFDLGFFSDSGIVAEIAAAISPVFDEFPVSAVQPVVLPVADMSELDLSNPDYANSHIVIDFAHIEDVPASNIDHIPNFRANATYVIVGGLRGLGLATAGFAVTNGARHIVLVGRSKPDEEAQKLIDSMRDKGAQVFIANGSVTDENFIASLFQQIKKDMPPLKGVVHSAVVLMDKLLVKHGWGEFAQVLDPKVAGAWLMHKYTLDIPLDFFVLYSSMTSMIGNPGQVAYGAGNAFMDGLAQHRRLLGLPTISFNWGGVSDIGVLARSSVDVAGMLDTAGSFLLTPAEVLEAFGNDLYSTRSGIAVLRCDWPKYFSVNAPLAPRIRYKSLSSSSSSNQQSDKSDEAAVLKAIRASPDDGVQILEEFLQQYFMKMLEYSSPPDVDVSIQHLGIESVLAAQMRQYITVQVGVTMPVVWFFSNITTTDLAKRLFDLIPAEDLRPLPVENTEPTQSDSVTPGEDGIVVSDLSLNQKSIYDVSPPGSVDMNLYGYCVFSWRPEHTEMVGQLIQAAVDHHPILKAAYKKSNKDDESIVQVVDLKDTAYVEYIDAENKTLEEVETDIVKQANVPFDLTKGHLIKTFIYTRDKQMIIAFVFHHLIVDLVSCFIFFEDVMNMYSSKQKLPKREVIEHDEFVKWEKQWLVSEEGKRAEKFWKSLTKDHNLLKPIELNLKSFNPNVKKGINIFDIHLTAAEHAGLSALVKKLNTTPFIILWVAYQILLVQGGNSYGPVVMGSVFTTRSNNQMAKRMIGANVNCLPLVNTVYANNTLREIVEAATPLLSASMDHAAYHHSLIPKKEGANLLQHMIVDDRVEYNQKLTSLVTKLKFDTVSVNEDTQLKILSESEDSNKIWMQLLLRKDLFDKKAIETYNSLFKNIISHLFTKDDVVQSRIDQIGH